MTSATDTGVELSTRERILEVAAELFIEHGYDTTSLREIADRLGFTKAALYYHFQSKEDLLAALLAPGDALVRELMHRLEDADGLEGWADALSWVIGQLEREPRLLQAPLPQPGGGREAHRDPRDVRAR